MSDGEGGPDDRCRSDWMRWSSSSTVGSLWPSVSEPPRRRGRFLGPADGQAERVAGEGPAGAGRAERHVEVRPGRGRRSGGRAAAERVGGVVAVGGLRGGVLGLLGDAVLRLVAAVLVLAAPVLVLAAPVLVLAAPVLVLAAPVLVLADAVLVLAAVGRVAGAVVGGAVRGLRFLAAVHRLLGRAGTPEGGLGAGPAGPARSGQVGRDRVERGGARVVAGERRAALEPAGALGRLLRTGPAAEAVEDGAVGAERDGLGEAGRLDLRLLGRGSLRVQRVGGRVALGPRAALVVLPGELGLVEGDRRPVVVVLHLVRRLAGRRGR
ncbi:hypothetical protein GWI34_35770, partial [Actinomadura sp. DSM 109109]|nr:hypothetical protein [Actinomadura lepetitiana]